MSDTVTMSVTELAAMQTQLMNIKEAKYEADEKVAKLTKGMKRNGMVDSR